MANITSANGEMTLVGQWAEKECELLDKVFKNSWTEQTGSHWTQCFVYMGDTISEGINKYSFSGAGRWSFWGTLYELVSNRSYESIEAGFLSEDDYNELVKIMFDKQLAIRFEYIEDGDEGVALHQLSEFVSIGKTLEATEITFDAIDYAGAFGEEAYGYQYEEYIDEFMEEAYESIGSFNPSKFADIVYSAGVSLHENGSESFSSILFTRFIEIIKEDLDDYRASLEAKVIAEGIDSLLKKLEENQKKSKESFEEEKVNGEKWLSYNCKSFDDPVFQKKLTELKNYAEIHSKITHQNIKSLDSLVDLLDDKKEYDVVKNKIVKFFEKILIEETEQSSIYFNDIKVFENTAVDEIEKSLKRIKN